MNLNFYAIASIYRFEMARMRRTLFQSIATPVISTSLYFIVFGAAIGSRIAEIDGVGYGSFIVPGLIMLMLLTESISNASFGIHMPRFTGTIFEVLSAPISFVEVIAGYVGAAATKSVILGATILMTASLFVDIHIAHPFWMLLFLVLTSVSFSLFGFILGIWADGFEKLQIVPALIITPLAFLGGSFYSISMLPPFWQTVTLFNPVVYLISGFRWSFYDNADVSVALSLSMTCVFLCICLVIIWWIFRTGYKLRT
ncbi:MAG: ABC transporter permease [Gammaproteobacteria bacterium]|nr:ABC transporter permease [Gammaproteobacteria bacterium]MDH4314755.1 ABC transporter permease [Gammaproteobacteria bacterium]MDH5212841.1 ABC transporter permease [Gammaproteobacteria bacterium]MDH5499515.1 ABC transporter permease [Gammaproteobacteria bacterium]